MKQPPSWYSVRVFSSSERLASTGWIPGIVEDRIILVSAASEEEAREKGLAAAQREDTRYETASGDSVRWTTDEVLEVCTLLDGQIVDGSEIYHAYLDQSKVAQLRDILSRPISE
jgi:hypothetical protein